MIVEEDGFGHGPFVGGEEDQIGTAAVHLVGLVGMDALLLHALNLQGVEFLIIL